MGEAYQFIIHHPEMFGRWVLDHLSISLVAVLVSFFLGLPLGIFIAGKGREPLANVVLYCAEIMMTVPSLALFGLLMLLLSHLGLSTLGFLPAVITLIIYGQLPILRNVYAAIQKVDPIMIEVGRGMGMTETQLLFKVKLPLAAPVIAAGLRNALVLIIGIAAIAALIGAGGLGVPIFRGLRNARTDLIIVGGTAVSVLALAADGLLYCLERRLTSPGLKE